VARGLRRRRIKVTVTRVRELDACADFFSIGDCEKLVYCASGGGARPATRLGQVATVSDGGSRWTCDG
jgi:5-amino-6-(5-phosphoribosylamino)uracil reductase